jgi:hypothetical protein
VKNRFAEILVFFSDRTESMPIQRGQMNDQLGNAIRRTVSVTWFAETNGALQWMLAQPESEAATLLSRNLLRRVW